MKMRNNRHFVCSAGPTHAIGIFKNYIFDANNTTVKKLSMKNLKQHDLDKINTIKGEIEGKITCWMFYCGNLKKL